MTPATILLNDTVGDISLSSRTITAETKTVDDILGEAAQGKVISFMKIDVEGHKYAFWTYDAILDERSNENPNFAHEGRKTCSGRSLAWW